MTEKLDLSLDINQIVKSVSLKKSVLALAISLGIFGTLTPFLFKQLDRESKSLLLLSGLIGNLTASLLPRNTKDEKLKVFYEKQVSENYANQLKHEVLRTNAVTEIREKNLLANYIDDDSKVPFFQKQYWANKFNVTSLMTSFFVDDEPQEQYQQLSEKTNDWVQNQPQIESVQKIEIKPDMQWIVDIAEKSCLHLGKRSNQHFKIDGGSQSGKSTFISLLIALISKKSEKIQINLIDPKYPMTQWQLKPSFVGFDQVVDGINTAIAELDNRKKMSMNAAKNNQALPEFTRYLVIVDEWDTIWSNGQGYADVIDKKTAMKLKGNLQRILKESAAYNMSLILVGQSPLSTDNGFSRSSLNSATRIVLGNEALKWSQDAGFPFKSIAGRLSNELEEIISSGARVALIAPNLGSSPYVKEIPHIDLQELFGKNEVPKVQDEALTDTQKAFKVIQDWVGKRENTPTAIEVLEVWEKLTGEKLNENGLKYLMEKLGI
jgi:hypothetical protein